MNNTRLFGFTCLAIAFATVIASCGDKTTRSTGWEFSRNMYDPIGYNPDQPNHNFTNGQTAQIPPAGTTPVGFERYPYPNTMDGYLAASEGWHNPLPLTEENKKAGEKLFVAFCSPCHGADGRGSGPITMDRQLTDENGTRTLENFPHPPSYAKSDGISSSRGGLMSDLTDGKIYHTIMYGLNLMGSHASQLSPEERWKVVMYVHELQKK